MEGGIAAVRELKLDTKLTSCCMPCFFLGMSCSSCSQAPSSGGRITTDSLRCSITHGVITRIESVRTVSVYARRKFGMTGALQCIIMLADAQ